MEDTRHWTVTDFAAKKDIIMAGMGWGGLPEYLVLDELARGELVPLKIDGFDIRSSHQYLIRRKDQAMGMVAQCIWDRLRDNCGDQG
jgi:DNA-binding transcriptional LysR family regulator